MKLPPKTVYVDKNGRVSMAKVGRKQDTMYLVEVMPDGVLILTPATVVPKVAK